MDIGGLLDREVFRYIGKEDSPRSLTYQITLMKKVGFEKIENIAQVVKFCSIWRGQDQIFSYQKEEVVNGQL